MDTSYLTSQVATIIGQLHGLFDEIGVPHHERESREAELFAALSETLHNQLRLVTAEKNELVEEAQRIIKTIKQMEASLDDSKSKDTYDLDRDELKVTFPLSRSLQSLKEKYNTISKIHKERFEQVRKLVDALESYSSHLEASFIKIKLPPTSLSSSIPPTFDLSPSYVTALDSEFTRVYEEYNRRIITVQTTSEEIVKLWAELGTPQPQTENLIVKFYRDSPEQLGLHEEDIARLKGKRDKLLDEKRGRERRLKELRTTVESLWDKLGVEEPERKRFLASNRGCGLRSINEFEDELHRLNELKRQNLHIFVEEARCRLQELWDGLYFSEEEMLDFTPAFSDVYSDALLSAHETEITRLEALKEQRAPTLELIDKHRSLIKDRNDLAASSQDASRLMARGNKGEKRDPTRLLREEKMRKRIAKELPKVEAELKKVLEKWEDEYGRPFLVHGERYLDDIESAAPSSKPAAPARARTPAGNRTTNTAPSSQRAPSAARNPPSRAGAKTPAGSRAPSTVKRNPLANSTSTAGGRTPSKIPARAPLSSTNGNISPERRYRAAPEPVLDPRAIVKMGPPARAPPPKMRDLFVPPPAPTPVNGYGMESQRSISVASSGGSVRPVSPEDVYDDRRFMGDMHSSMMRSTPMEYNGAHSMEQQYRAQLAGTRQISTTSTTSNAISGASGSENWETFDDASEPEVDASEAYYARLKAARTKRFTPEGGYAAPLGGSEKKLKGIRGVGVVTETMVENEGGRLVAVSGSDAGWTDEDAF